MNGRLQRLLYALNPRKLRTCEYLIEYHAKRYDKIIIFSDDVPALILYCEGLKLIRHQNNLKGDKTTYTKIPYLYGASSEEERRKVSWYIDIFLANSNVTYRVWLFSVETHMMWEYHSFSLLNLSLSLWTDETCRFKVIRFWFWYVCVLMLPCLLYVFFRCYLSLNQVLTVVVSVWVKWATQHLTSLKLTSSSKLVANMDPEDNKLRDWGVFWDQKQIPRVVSTLSFTR